MASQSSIIGCGTKMALLTMALKFLVGPALMAVASYVVGLRDMLLKAAIVQVCLSLSFFYAVSNHEKTIIT